MDKKQKTRVHCVLFILADMTCTNHVLLEATRLAVVTCTGFVLLMKGWREQLHMFPQKKPGSDAASKDRLTGLSSFSAWCCMTVFSVVEVVFLKIFFNEQDLGLLNHVIASQERHPQHYHHISHFSYMLIANHLKN